MNQKNNCTFIVENYTVIFPCEYEKPNKKQAIEAINKEFKKIVKSKEWKSFSRYHFGIDILLIKDIKNIEYHSKYKNIQIYKDCTFSADITIKLECELVTKL